MNQKKLIKKAMDKAFKDFDEYNYARFCRMMASKNDLTKAEILDLKFYLKEA